MYKLALGAKTNASRLYYYTDDEFLVFPSKIIGQNTLVKLISDEKSIVPDQRRSNGQIELEIPKNQLSPGHYTLVTQEDTLGVLSFNLPKSSPIPMQIR